MYDCNYHSYVHLCFLSDVTTVSPSASQVVEIKQYLKYHAWNINSAAQLWLWLHSLLLQCVSELVLQVPFPISLRCWFLCARIHAFLISSFTPSEMECCPWGSEPALSVFFWSCVHVLARHHDYGVMHQPAPITNGCLLLSIFSLRILPRKRTPRQDDVLIMQPSKWSFTCHPHHPMGWDVPFPVHSSWQERNRASPSDTTFGVWATTALYPRSEQKCGPSTTLTGTPFPTAWRVSFIISSIISSSD